jgi:hypothetical protein
MDNNAVNKSSEIRNMINFQFDISWQLLEYHLNGIDEEECLWQPSVRGLHVHKETDLWRSDWPDTESYDIGPASIAWLTWHILFWWSMVMDYSFGSGTMTREEVQWPGSIKAVKEKVAQLRKDWTAAVEALSDEELLTCTRTCWPFTDRPFCELAAWLSLELMKNASEIGYCRFLYASQNNN